MADIAVTIVLPSGGVRRADIPDDVPVGDLMAELASLLELPTVGPDGRPMGYRMDSKAPLDDHHGYYSRCGLGKCESAPTAVAQGLRIDPGGHLTQRLD